MSKSNEISTAAPLAATIITGGGRGIGWSIAMRMAQETAVLVVGRTEADLKLVCEAISQAGGQADYVIGDVSKPATARKRMRA
ncbi:MAG: SDR family NAD(P)-dependent oxidoreductase [Candidatus Melainabacteria bacterium]|nr:SDR family NAD(P)-dependent oxidoreductase [Candidatus Melainabacteria bacterium]